MIEELEIIQGFLEKHTDYCEESYQGIHHIEVISSYSPCKGCSDRLCDLKKNLEEKLKICKSRNSTETEVDELSTTFNKSIMLNTENINFQITFSTFYYHDNSENEIGLINLLKNEIKLDTFTDDNWEYFFEAAGLSSEIQSKEKHLVTKRQKREEDDSKLLQYFNLLVPLYPIIDYCKERGIKLAKHI